MYENLLCGLYLLSVVFVVFVVHVVFFVLVVFVVICQWLPKWPIWAAKKQFVWKSFHFWVGRSSSFLALACRVWQKVKWSWFVWGRFKITLFMNLLLLQPTYCVVFLPNQVFLGPHLLHKRMINWLDTLTRSKQILFKERFFDKSDIFKKGFTLMSTWRKIVYTHICKFKCQSLLERKNSDNIPNSQYTQRIRDIRDLKITWDIVTFFSHTFCGKFKDLQN